MTLRDERARPKAAVQSERFYGHSAESEAFARQRRALALGVTRDIGITPAGIAALMDVAFK